MGVNKGHTEIAMNDAVEEVAKNLIPPVGDQKRFRYDLTVSMVLVGVVVMSTLHIAWACGYFALFGIPGFASADEVNHQQQSLNSIQIELVNNDIRNFQRQVCLAQKAGNSSALVAWSNQLQGAKQSYYNLSNPHQWPLSQSCDELIIESSSN